MKLFIPPLGTVLTLAVPWTLTVFSETRNRGLIDLSGFKKPERIDTTRPDWWKTAALGPFTFPVGTELIVDRIYIRHNCEDYDSVTFRATHYTVPPVVGKKEKVIRFWSRLSDVNTMHVVDGGD